MRSEGQRRPREVVTSASIPNIWWILGIALFLRTSLPILGFFYTRDITIFYTPDTASYVGPAMELLAHHRFFNAGAPEIVRTPGYPLLLMAGLRLGRLELVTITLQVLLSCFTVYMVYRTARLLFQREVIALVAAALYAIEPLSILFSGLLASETLFGAVVMVGAYYLVRYVKRRCLVDLLVSGGVLAGSAYIRPIGYFLPIIIAGALAAWALVTAQQDRLELIAHATAFLIVSVVSMGLWQVRNTIQSGYHGFSAISDVNMYFYLAASVLAAEQHASFSQMQDRLGFDDPAIYFQLHPEQRKWSAAQRFEYMGRDAAQILLGNPLIYAQIYIQGLLRGVFDPGSTEFLRFFDLYPKQGGLLEVVVGESTFKSIGALLSTPLLLFSVLVLLPLQLMYLSGACVAVFTPLKLDMTVFLLVIIVVYYLGIAGGPTDWGRFRHPAMPLICILAGSGFYLVSGGLRPQLQGLTRMVPASLSPLHGRGLGKCAQPSVDRESINRSQLHDG